MADAVHVALDMARALEHAHSRNVVHRDIKPDNILVTRSGVAKLADLGLAKRTDETSHLTAARQGFGTPHYMPYEQAINAKQADHRSDIYALGATLYHLVTGDVPFSGANHLEVVEKKALGAFLPASALNSEVPPILDEIINKMMERDPRDRYQTASEVIIDLERSRLASPVLSFADLDLAMQDPAAQKYLASSAEPTRLDMAGATPAARTEVWFLRYRVADGTWRKLRATTQQIVKLLRNPACRPAWRRPARIATTTSTGSTTMRSSAASAGERHGEHGASGSRSRRRLRWRRSTADAGACCWPGRCAGLRRAGCRSRPLPSGCVRPLPRPVLGNQSR